MSLNDLSRRRFNRVITAALGGFVTGAVSGCGSAGKAEEAPAAGSAPPAKTASDVEAKLKALKLELPTPGKPLGIYKPCLIAGNFVYTSGHGPLLPSGKMTTGKIGVDIDQKGGYDAARQAGLAMLASLKQSLGNLDRLKRLVKTLGMVNCASDFQGHTAVINGFSDLMRELLGEENGVGARSSVGMSSLPGNMAVEVEAIFEIA